MSDETTATNEARAPEAPRPEVDGEVGGEPGTTSAGEVDGVAEGVVEGVVEVPFDVDDFPAGLRGALEAVLMVVDEPIGEAALASALEVTVERVRAELESLARDYDEQLRGFQLRDVAGGWRFYSRPAYSRAVEKFVLDGQQSRLTQAALETLAVVAYRQPVSRARVSAVRGVSVDGVVKTLLTRGLVTEVGHDEVTGAVLYGTTPYFLQRMGLASLDDLPALAPYLPEADVLDEIDALGREERPRRASPSGSMDDDHADEAPAPAAAPHAAPPAAPPPHGTGHRTHDHEHHPTHDHEQHPTHDHRHYPTHDHEHHPTNEPTNETTQVEDEEQHA